MNAMRLILLSLALLTATVAGLHFAHAQSTAASQPAEAAQAELRFEAVNVYIDPAGQSLAAYQLEFTAGAADVTLVGIEGGEHAAFAQPPYYDPKAQLANRIVFAALNTGADLPKAKTQVATIMLRLSGKQIPHYEARLMVAASPEAKPIEARTSVRVASPTGDKSAASLLRPSLQVAVSEFSNEGAKR